MISCSNLVISYSKRVPNLFTFQVSGKFFVCTIQTLNDVRRDTLLVLIRRVQIGVGLLDQSPPGPGHPVEAGTVWKLKSSIVMGSEVRDLIGEGSPQKKTSFLLSRPAASTPRLPEAGDDRNLDQTMGV